MHYTHRKLSSFPVTSIRLMTASLLLAGLAACGGGSNDNATPTSTKSYTGTVTAYDNPLSFSVDGIPVDASGTSATPQGMGTGSRVEVHGAMVNGTLKANKVQLDDGDDRDDDNANPNELEGLVTAYASPTSFSVDGIPVDASAAPHTLSVGMRIEVYGTMGNGILVATRVELEDSHSDASADDNGADDSDDDNCTTGGTSDCSDVNDDHDDHDEGDSDSDDSNDDNCPTPGKSRCETD